MTARTQITLDPELLRKARRRAAERGASLAEYVRTVLARDLEEPSSSVDPSFVFNLGRGGRSNIAAEKDSMIGEAVEDLHR